MKNQSKQYEQTLNQYRNEINEIDDKILDFLKNRAHIIHKVRQLKVDNGEKFFIKSARESDMIKSLLKKADPILSKSLIVNLWRKIITSSNVIEQDLKIAIYNPNRISDYGYLVREYYADFVSITNYDSINNIIGEIEKKSAQISIFNLPNESEEDPLNNWWINLANNNLGLKVFARIPFVATSQINLVAMAIKKPEKSESDCSLLCIELSQEINNHTLLSTLKEAGLDAKILKSAKLKQIENIIFYLVEVSGFFEEENIEIKSLTQSKIKPFVKILGHYSAQIKLD